MLRRSHCVCLLPYVTLLFLLGCSAEEESGSEVVVVQEHNDEDAVHVPLNESSAATVTDTSSEQKTEPAAAPATNATASRKSKVNMPMMEVPASEDIVFKDDVSTNVKVPIGLDGLTFVDTNGGRVALQDYLGKKNVILVFTEGFAGMLCPFCKTQTSRLVANYDKFAALDTQILVVYPGERDHLDEFVEAARTTGKTQVDRVPFPIVLDREMTAVDYFDIRSKLAHPSTYVIDKAGKVKLAYVGADMTADRPSVKALLEAVKSTGQEGGQ